MRARSALRRGWHELWRAPAPTFLALAGALAAALAGRAAWLRAADALAAARPGRALATLLVGLAAAALLADSTRATALVAYAGPPRPFARTLLLGLARTPALLGVRAVELMVYAALALGELFLLGRGLLPLGHAAGRQALAATACLAPALLVATGLFAAARVAQTLIARGLPPAPALAVGFDVVLRRFATLARLALLGVAAAAPLWTIGLFAPPPLGGLVTGFVALWLYAALVVLVGRDGRLALG